MSLLIGFNPDAVPDFAPMERNDTYIPDGKYRIMLTNVLEDQSKAGNLYVRWTWIVVDGQYHNQTFETIHFPHGGKDPEMSMRIFQGFAKSLCRALRLSGIGGYDDLCNRPVIANVKLGKWTDKNGNPMQANRITHFEESGVPAQPRPQPPQQQVQQRAQVQYPQMQQPAQQYHPEPHQMMQTDSRGPEYDPPPF